MKGLKERLGLAFHYIAKTVEAFREIALYYPASLEHHHNYKGGLWEHSLTVAERMIDRLEVYPRDGEKEGEFIRRRTKLMLYTTLTGLFHDAGKVGLYIPDTKGYFFHPFLSYRPDFTGYKRENISYRDNYLSLLVMGYCIAKDEVFLKSEFFDWTELNLVGEAIVKEHSEDKSENLYLNLLRACDMEDVKAYMESKTDLYDKALEYLKRLLRTLRNGDDFFYAGELTGIVSPRITKDLFYNGFLQEIQEKVDEFKIYQEWQERGYCEGLKEVRIIKPDGTSFRKPLQLLLVKSEFLWKSEETSHFQVYRLEVGKAQEKEPTKPKVEVEL